MGGNMVDLFKVPNKKVYKPDVPALAASPPMRGSHE
jgi:hypothetical protein